MIQALPGYEQMLKMHPNFTFIFEYISLADAHVVKYKKEQEGLYLIGIRDNLTGHELSYHKVIDIANHFNIPTTVLFDKTLGQILNELDDKNSEEAEGFVINIDGYKVKVKYNDYVHIHKALSKLSSINLIIRSIADDQYDDLLSKLPVAYHDSVKKVAAIVFRYIKDTEQTANEYFQQAPKTSQKEFMIWIDRNVPKKFRGFCRELYFGKEINVIKFNQSGNPKYLKLNQMGVNDYSTLFTQEEKDE